MKRNQIILDEEHKNLNKEFFKSMFNETEFVDGELMQTRTWFDISDHDYSDEMTLDKFLDLMDNSHYLRLQIGSPTVNKIHLGCKISSKSLPFTYQ